MDSSDQTFPPADGVIKLTVRKEVRRIPVKRLMDERNIFSYEKLIEQTTAFYSEMSPNNLEVNAIKFSYVDLDGDKVTVSSVDEFLEGWKHVGKDVLKVTAIFKLFRKAADDVNNEEDLINKFLANQVNEGPDVNKMKEWKKMKKRMIKSAIEKVQAERGDAGMRDKVQVPIMIASEIIKVKAAKKGPCFGQRASMKWERFRRAAAVALNALQEGDELKSGVFTEAMLNVLHTDRALGHPRRYGHHFVPHYHCGPPPPHHHGPPPPHHHGPPPPHHHGPPPPHHRGPPPHGPPPHGPPPHCWKGNFKVTDQVAMAPQPKTLDQKVNTNKDTSESSDEASFVNINNDQIMEED